MKTSKKNILGAKQIPNADGSTKRKRGRPSNAAVALRKSLDEKENLRQDSPTLSVDRKSVSPPLSKGPPAKKRKSKHKRSSDSDYNDVFELDTSPLDSTENPTPATKKRRKKDGNDVFVLDTSPIDIAENSAPATKKIRKKSSVQPTTSIVNESGSVEQVEAKPSKRKAAGADNELLVDDEAEIIKYFSKYVDDGNYKEHALRCVEAPKKLNRKQKASEERVCQEKRIEDAIARGCSEIATFEFMQFSDPLGPKFVGSPSVCIYMITCTGSKVKSKVDLFRSSEFICNDKGVSEVNVVRYSVPSDMLDDVTAVYLAAKVVAKCPMTDSKRTSKARHSTANKDSITVERSFYGAKCIIKKHDGEEPRFVHLNSLLGLICPDDEDASNVGKVSFSLDKDSWMNRAECLEELSMNIQQRQKRGPTPGVSFEISDEHCSHDWEMVRKNQKKRLTKRHVEEGQQVLRFVYSGNAPVPDEKCETDDVPAGVEHADLMKVIDTLPHMRHPFNLAIYDTMDEMLNDLNTHYTRLYFREKDSSTIYVDLSGSSHLKVPVGVLLSAVRESVVPTWRPVGIIPDIELPIVFPTYVPVGPELSTLGGDGNYVYSVPSGNVEQQWRVRRIANYDCTSTEKEFMDKWNASFDNVRYDATSRSGVLQGMKAFIEKHVVPDREGPMAILAQMHLVDLRRVGAVDDKVAAELFDLIDG